MPHFEFYELPPEAKDKLSHLRWQISGNRMLLALHRLEALLRKANFNPNQPRVAAGTREGGQWTGSGGHLHGSEQPRLLPVAYNSGNEPDEPPHIPIKRPEPGRVRNTIIKRTVRYLVGAARAGSRVNPYVWGAIEAASWAEPLTSYFDGPKTLEELQRAALDSETGYDIHHVVERGSARAAGFPTSRIEAPENRVRIPTLKHWEVNSWFETEDDGFRGLTPREYLRNPKIGWEERVRIGRAALVKAGVLKK